MREGEAEIVLSIQYVGAGIGDCRTQSYVETVQVSDMENSFVAEG